MGQFAGLMRRVTTGCLTLMLLMPVCIFVCNDQIEIPQSHDDVDGGGGGGVQQDYLLVIQPFWMR